MIRQIYILYILCIVLIGCNQRDNVSEKNIKIIKIAKSEKEDFDIFLSDFSQAEEFQKQRITPNAIDCIVTIDGDSTVEKIDKEKWKLIELIHDGQIIHVYNNFNMQIEDTEERVFSVGKIESGAQTNYYFRRVNNEWMLVKRVIYLD